MPLSGALFYPAAQGSTDEQQTLALLQAINNQKIDAPAFIRLTGAASPQTSYAKDEVSSRPETFLQPLPADIPRGARQHNILPGARMPEQKSRPAGQYTALEAERNQLKKTLTNTRKKNRELQQAIASQRMASHNSETTSLKQQLLDEKKRHRGQIEELNLALKSSHKKIDSLQSQLAIAKTTGEDNSKILLAESQKQVKALQQQVALLMRKHEDRKSKVATTSSTEEIKVQKLVAALAVSQQKINEQGKRLAPAVAAKPNEKEKMAKLVEKIATLSAKTEQQDKELTQAKQALTASQTNVEKLRRQLIAITQKFTVMRRGDTPSLESQ